MPPRTAVASAPSLQQALLTHVSVGDPLTLTGRPDSVSVGSLLLPLECTRFCAFKSLCFPQSRGSSAIKSHCPSKSDFLGILSFFAGFPSWEIRCGGYNLHNSVRTSLILLFSSLWVTHPMGMGFDFIMIAPLLPSNCCFSLVLGCGLSFLGGRQHPPVNGCSTAGCDFGVLTGEDELMFFHFTIFGLNLHTAIFENRALCFKSTFRF